VTAMPWTLDGIRHRFIGHGPNGPDVHPSLNESKQTKKQTNKQTSKKQFQHIKKKTFYTKRKHSTQKENILHKITSFLAM
jgi:hypothetical protein